MTEEGTPQALNSEPDFLPTVDVSPASFSETANETAKPTVAPPATSPEAGLNTEAAAAQTPPAETAPAPEKTPYHLEPAWQRIMEERNQARIEAARAQAQIDLLQQQQQAIPQQQAPPDFIDITQKTAEELREWITEDPQGYSANLARQVRAEVRDELLGQVRTELQMRDNMSAEQKQQSRLAETFNNYAKTNTDFAPMWQNGTIQRFMQENPGHNAMSAHQMLTMQGRIERAATDAAKKKEEEVVKQYQAKNNLNVLGSGPAVSKITQDGLPDEMKNPKKYGGTVSVLANRLMQRRQGGS